MARPATEPAFCQPLKMPPMLYTKNSKKSQWPAFRFIEIRITRMGCTGLFYNKTVFDDASRNVTPRLGNVTHALPKYLKYTVV